ncbi:MAG: hypothetical protein OHK0048_24420 [Rhodoferax sp.]
MTPEEFSKAAETILSPIVDLPGAILYSAASTLREGSYYFLGLNPGGSGGRSIREHISILPSINTNSYVDEAWDWGSGNLLKAGAHPLQRNAWTLFHWLGVPVERVCASNLIFAQSSNESGSGYPKLAYICWPVHELILGIVKPKTIITFGKKPFEFVSEKLGASRLPDIPSGHGNWICREANSRSARIVGLPHLSRYHLHGKTDVMQWLSKKDG